MKTYLEVRQPVPCRQVADDLISLTGLGEFRPDDETGETGEVVWKHLWPDEYNAIKRILTNFIGE